MRRFVPPLPFGSTGRAGVFAAASVLGAAGLLWGIVYDLSGSDRSAIPLPLFSFSPEDPG